MRGFRRSAAMIPRRPVGSADWLAATLAGVHAVRRCCRAQDGRDGVRARVCVPLHNVAACDRESSGDRSVRPYTTLRPVADLDLHGDLVIEVHEDLLNRIVSRTDQRQSPVRDFVLGADVHGTESTNTTSTSTCSRPTKASRCTWSCTAQSVAHGRLHAAGRRPHARAASVHVARKPIVHEGRLFRTERPQVDVTPNNQTLGADTVVSGVPFLGDVASSIAFQAAEAPAVAGRGDRRPEDSRRGRDGVQSADR